MRKHPNRRELKRVAKHLEGEDIFCFTYGDCLANVNIKEEIKFHKLFHKLYGKK